MPFESFNLEQDKHTDFVKKYSANKIRLRVNTDSAGFFFPTILDDYAGMQATYRTLFFGGVIAGVIAIFFVGWWSLIGFIIAVIGRQMSRRHTDQSVIEEALKNPVAYDEFVKANVLGYEK